MSSSHLHYGGEKYILDDARASEFVAAVQQAITSNMHFDFVVAHLQGGNTLQVAVSAGIPLAVLSSDKPKQAARVLR